MMGACQRGPRVTGSEHFNFPKMQELGILQGVWEIQNVWKCEVENKSGRNLKIFVLIFEGSKTFTRHRKPKAMITSRAFLKASFFCNLRLKKNVRYGRVTNALRFFQKEGFDMARVLKSYKNLRRSKILTYLTLLKYPIRKMLFSLQ